MSSEEYDDAFARSVANKDGMIDLAELDIAGFDDNPLLVMLSYENAGLQEWVDRILKFAPNLNDEPSAFFDKYDAALNALLNCPPVRRLAKIHQFGVKRNPHMTAWEGTANKRGRILSTSPFAHTRMTHSVQVAAPAIGQGLHLELSPEDIIAVTFAAMLHDVGYCPYSHDGDSWLVGREFPSHEKRGQRIVETDPDIRRAISLAGLSVARVQKIMREEGRLGRVLAFADSLYILPDSRLVGRPLPDSFAWRVIESVSDLREDRLVVTDPAPLQELLDHRAVLSRDVYYALPNKLSAAALAGVFDFMCKEKLLDPEFFSKADDGDIDRLLRSLFNDRERDLPYYLRSMYSLANGFWTHITEWDSYRVSTEIEALHIIGRHLSQKKTPPIWTEPFDYTQKTIKVELPSGETKTLKADDSILTEDDKAWFVFTFRS